MQTRRLAVSFEGLTALLLNQLASYGVSKWCENTDLISTQHGISKYEYIVHQHQRC